MMGVLKTKMIVTFWQHPHSWLFHTLTQKCNLIPNLKIPTKSSKIPNFPSQTTYRTTYRQTLLKSSISATSKPKKSNSHLAKNSPTISKFSLFISTFTDNRFHSKNFKSYIPNIGATINYTQNYQYSNRTVLFLCKKIKSNREYIIRNS